VTTCRSCQRRPANHARGLCGSCYNRWRYYGKPQDGPPPPRTGGPCADRIEDYLDLRMWGLSKQQAAERLGVTLRTIWRYEHRLRQELAA
jgi:hypothetical protein